MTETVFCAVYARYSTNNQREASIEDQIRKCRELAATKGWVILDEHIYYDKAQSGTRTNMRHAFKEMMQTAMSNNCPFQRIIVDETSRIARNTKEALDIFSLLTYYGIHVYYVSQGIDTSHETAEEMITINGLIDSLYIRNLSKETYRGIEGQVLSGYNSGGKRYGYRSEPVYNGKVDIYGNPEADGYILKINPDEVDTIIRIFKMFGEQGYSAKKIATILNEEIKRTDAPTPPRGKYWCSSTILGSKKAFRGILNNEIYIGHYYWNRSFSKRNPENGKKKCIAKDSSKWIVVQKPELRIISDELWEKVKKRQKQLQTENSGAYNKSKHSYSVNLLTGLVKCGKCGGNIAIVSGGKWAKYGCSNNWNKGAAVCDNNIKLNKKDFERSVISSLNLNFDKNEHLDYLHSRVDEIIKNHLGQTNPKWRREALGDQLKKTEKEIANFINAIKAGIFSDIVKNQLEKAEKKKAEIEQFLAENQKETSILPEITRNSISMYLQDIRETLSLHPLYGRALLSKVIALAVLQPQIGSHVIDVNCKTL
ncbi:MAG: recombinase family protein [Nitrospirae bacterium]|nr:recombinase family protein [Nitrospirota bacterium]